MTEQVTEKVLEKEITIPGTNDKWKVVLKEDGTIDMAYLNGKEMTFIPVPPQVDLSKMEEDAANVPDSDPSKVKGSPLKVCYPIRDRYGNIIGWHCT
jgi:hypothetical protein